MIFIRRKYGVLNSQNADTNHGDFGYARIIGLRVTSSEIPSPKQ